MKKNFKLQTPWVTYQKMLNAFFKYDDDVNVGEIDGEESGIIHIPVEIMNHKKFLALQKILNTRIVFGNITVFVDLYDEENGEQEEITFDTVKQAFDGNGMVDDFKVITDNVGVEHGYVIFDNTEIIQFQNDNLMDCWGNYNALPQDVAKQLFNLPWIIQFCTKDFREN